jgi:hypothetical protein
LTKSISPYIEIFRFAIGHVFNNSMEISIFRCMMEISIPSGCITPKVSVCLLFVCLCLFVTFFLFLYGRTKSVRPYIEIFHQIVPSVTFNKSDGNFNSFSYTQSFLVLMRRTKNAQRHPINFLSLLIGDELVKHPK